MARIFVTGGGGFIGCAVASALAARGDTVTAFDMGESPALKALRARAPNVSFVPGELTEWPQLAEAMKQARPDAVIHCAAVVGVVNSLASPLYTMRVNVEGSLNVLSAMRLFEVGRLVNLSSEEVYGPFTQDVIDETHACFPVQPYGISKFAVEQLTRDFAAANGIEAVHIRTCWVYGPGLPRPRVPKTPLEAGLAGRAFHIPNGAGYRVDQVYIDDLVAGILGALDHRGHQHDVYHITTGEAPSLAEMVAIMRELIPGAQLSIGEGAYEVAGMPAVRKGALDCSRARAAFGYQPRYPLREGLAAYAEALSQG
jgi:nucleoside-diphosphate-sugar epimerase